MCVSRIPLVSTNKNYLRAIPIVCLIEFSFRILVHHNVSSFSINFFDTSFYGVKDLPRSRQREGKHIPKNAALSTSRQERHICMMILRYSISWQWLDDVENWMVP